MHIRRSLVLAGATLAIATPIAMAQGGSAGVKPPPPIVNPELPAACIPPGLITGQPKPEGYRPPANFRPAADCPKVPLFVPPPRKGEGGDAANSAQKPAKPTAQKPAKPTAQKPAKPTAQKPAKPTAQGEPGGKGEVSEGGARQADTPDVIPAFKAAFFRRTWQMQANVFEAVKAGTGMRLDVDVDRLVGVPRPLRAEAKFIRDFGVYVLVGPTTKVRIVNPDLEESFPASMQDIASDDEIRVRGRFLARSAWRTDGTGDKVPTMRATGIQIIDDTYTGDEVEEPTEG